MEFNFEASREEPLSKGYQHYTSFQKSQTETSLLLQTQNNRSALVDTLNYDQIEREVATEYHDCDESQFLSNESASELADILNPDELKWQEKLIEATEMGDFNQLKQVLTVTSLDITKVRSKQGLSLLQIAAQNDYEMILELLLNHVKQGQQAFIFSPPMLRRGFDLSNSTVRWLGEFSSEGFTALHYAAFQNNPKTIDILISYGANPHSTNELGINMLHIAA